MNHRMRSTASSSVSSAPAPAPADRKQASRRRILDVSGRALRRAGFHGVGIAEVMKQAGLTHGGFYAHFASRDALLRAAVEHAAADAQATLARDVAGLLAAGASPLRALIDTYLHERGLANRETGCAIAALASEMPRQSDEVADTARHAVRALHRRVKQALPPAEADAAWPIASAMLGALQLARTLGDNDEGRAVLAATRRELLARHAAD